MKTSALPESDAPRTEDVDDTGDDSRAMPCVLGFNASDPSGAGGLCADALAVGSVGAHLLPVVTGAYARDSSDTYEHYAFDEEAVAEQARAILQDVPVQAVKLGFVGSPETIGTIAAYTADYPDLPVVAYMPDLSWWNEGEIEAYLDAFRDLMLPQTTVLVGNHATLRRWLLPEWSADRPPGARDLAAQAATHGVQFVLVTGLPVHETHIDNVLASPQSVLASEKFERLPASFSGAGETLSAALAALLASGTDLVAAASEALSYMDRCLSAGMRPGMGEVVPDRLFWAIAEDEDVDAPDDPTLPDSLDFALPPHETRH